MINKIKETAGYAAYNASVGVGVAVVSGYLAGSMGHNVPNFSEISESLQANLKEFITPANRTFSNAGNVLFNSVVKILQLPFFLVGAAIGGLAFLVVKACNISSSKNHTADPLKVSHSVEVEKEKISNPINYKVKEAYKAAYASVKGLFCKPAAGSGDDHKSQEGLTHTK